MKVLRAIHDATACCKMTYDKKNSTNITGQLLTEITEKRPNAINVCRTASKTTEY